MENTNKKLKKGVVFVRVLMAGFGLGALALKFIDVQAMVAVIGVGILAGYVIEKRYQGDTNE